MVYPGYCQQDLVRLLVEKKTKGSCVSDYEED